MSRVETTTRPSPLRILVEPGRRPMSSISPSAPVAQRGSSAPLGRLRPRRGPAPADSIGADGGRQLIDAFGRRLTYLRVSVTDRCNLRCSYCLPEDADFPAGDRDFLRPDEIEAMVGALVRLGIRRVRLTGGEPLVRKDILDVARRIKALPR